MGLIINSALALVLCLIFPSLRLSTNNHSLPKLRDLLQEKETFVEPKGQFVNLSHGETHYILEGNPKGQLVVLVHGLFSEARDMRDVLPYLQEYHVLSYDLYGMGHSQAPANALFDERLYISQLAELLFKLNLREPAIFVGHSLGGAISSAFASRYPESVKALILVAPAGIAANVPFYVKFFVPVLTDILARLIGPFVIPKRVAGAFTDHTQWAPTIAQLEQARYYQLKNNQDYLSATFLCLQNFPIQSLPYFDDIAQHTFPVRVIWGADDETTPVQGASLLKGRIPRTEITVLEKVGHLVFHQAPRNVSNVVLSIP